MDIFVDIFHSLPFLSLLCIDRKWFYPVSWSAEFSLAILLKCLPFSMYNKREVYVYRISGKNMHYNSCAEVLIK